MGMAKRVPIVPGATGKYPTPKPVAKRMMKRFIFPSPFPSPPRGEGGVRWLRPDNDSLLLKIRFNLRDGIFPVMEDRGCKHGIGFS